MMNFSRQNLMVASCVVLIEVCFDDAHNYAGWLFEIGSSREVGERSIIYRFAMLLHC